MKKKIMLSAINTVKNYHVNRKYKDRLFRLIFQSKKDLLSLYNAINGSHYTDTDELEIRTLENAVYLGYKNDLSFLINNTLNLYEHQSTMNPNMPLRGLIYFVDMIKAYIEENGYNIYGKNRILLPTPAYIVFYNGIEDQPDVVTLRLSEAFAPEKVQEPSLECKAIMLNINMGHNTELMKRCERLEEYSYFVEAVRRYIDVGYRLQESVDHAIDECLNKGKIADILMKNRAEVKSMLLTDFSERKYRKLLKKEAIAEGREEGREEGRKEGREEGRKEGREEGQQETVVLFKRLLQDNRHADLEKALNDEHYRKFLMKDYGIF